MGLKRQSAFVGSVPQANVNVPPAPIGVRHQRVSLLADLATTVSLAGPEKASVKSKPVPESATVTGAATDDELTVSVPVMRTRQRWAERTTEAVQLAPAARLPVQVFCAMLNGADAASVTEPMA